MKKKKQDPASVEVFRWPRHSEKIIMVTLAVVGSLILVWQGWTPVLRSNYEFVMSPNQPREERADSAPVVVKRLPVSPPAPLSRLTFRAMTVQSENDGTTLAVKFGDEAMPLASLTKLMTALVLLDEFPQMDWAGEVTFTADDVRGGAVPHLRVGDTLIQQDLWQTMLVGSDNDAVAAFVRSVGWTELDAVNAMNTKAKALGLTTTHFEESTGLSPLNVSTTNEFAVVAKLALNDERIAEPLTKNSVTVTVNGKSRLIKSTDQDLKSYQNAARDGWRFVTGKTGYILASGYNAALIAEDATGNRFITVVFGAPTLKLRASNTDRLLDFAITNIKKALNY